MIFSFGMSKILGTGLLITVAGLALVGYLYKNSLKEIAYLESTVASYQTALEHLADENAKRDAVSLKRAQRIEELEARKQKTRVVVKEIHAKEKKWSDTLVPSGHSQLLYERSAQSRDREDQDSG